MLVMLAILTGRALLYWDPSIGNAEVAGQVRRGGEMGPQQVRATGSLHPFRGAVIPAAWNVLSGFGTTELRWPLMDFVSPVLFIFCDC